MLFNSFGFIVFFSIVAIFYYIFPHRVRSFWLLLAGIYFYMYSQSTLIIIPCFIILITFFCGLFIDKSSSDKRRKLYYLSGIIANIAILIFFKYVNFFISSISDIINFGHRVISKTTTTISHPLLFNIVVPLSISYITFQSIGYLMEVYRGNHPAETHIGFFATYLLFFPKIIAGPVERAHHFLPQLREKKEFDYNVVTAGLKLMLWGFFKKLVIADRLEIYNDTIFKNYTHHNSLTLILTGIFCAIQLYADFSGYTDIALGLAKALGFDLIPNFDRPFFAKSITDFWRRWHMSLSQWFRDYVYTTIIINKRSWGKWSAIYALNITFILLGLWHGPNWTFVLFGLLQGIALTIEFFTRKIRKQIRQKVPVILNNLTGTLVTFGFFCFSSIIFRAYAVNQAFGIIYRIFYWRRGGVFIGSISTMFYAILGIMILFITEFIQEYPSPAYSISLMNNKNKFVRHSTYVAIVMLIILFGVFNESQFIYFKF